MNVPLAKSRRPGFENSWLKNVPSEVLPKMFPQIIPLRIGMLVAEPTFHLVGKLKKKLLM